MWTGSRIVIAAVVFAVIQLPADHVRAETSGQQQQINQQVIANIETAVAQIEQAIASEEASIQSHLDAIAGIRPPLGIRRIFDNGPDTHPIVAKFLEIWGKAKTLEDQKNAVSAYRWAFGEWNNQMWGDDASFGNGDRLSDYEYGLPVLEEAEKHIEDIESSLDHLQDLQAALDGLNQTLSALVATTADRYQSSAQQAAANAVASAMRANQAALRVTTMASRQQHHRPRIEHRY